jgi:GT2 family glycosyltransferase
MQWIKKCLSSIVGTTQVIVIDNASTDDTLSYVSSMFPQVKIIRNRENLGFGKANNIGMTYALEQDADFVFLLNQDTYVYSNTVTTLVNTATKYPAYGILSPLQLSGSETIDLMFSNYLLANPNYYYDATFTKNIKDVYSYPFLNAAAWFLPKATLCKIGGFDPIFFHYGEDENYAQRVLYHSQKIGLVPNSVIIHDREQYTKTKKTLFSLAYYKAFEKHLKVSYANPNNNKEFNFWKRYKTKYLKQAIKALLGFNLSTFKGYMKQHKMLTKIIEDCKKSKSITKTSGSHYL